MTYLERRRWRRRRKRWEEEVEEELQLGVPEVDSLPVAVHLAGLLVPLEPGEGVEEKVEE